MPSPKSHRRGVQEKNKKGKLLSEKASSFHGRGAGGVVAGMLQRPRTVPDLLVGGRESTAEETVAIGIRPAKLTKVLLNVTIQRSTGPVQVLMWPEAAVEDLIAAALRQYAKEGRRPVLTCAAASGFDLHYSQFSLESLDRQKRLMELGSRNFFLCPKRAAAEESTAASGGAAVTSSNCSKEANRETKKGLPWLKFMELFAVNQP